MSTPFATWFQVLYRIKYEIPRVDPGRGIDLCTQNTEVAIHRVYGRGCHGSIPKFKKRWHQASIQHLLETDMN